MKKPLFIIFLFQLIFNYCFSQNLSDTSYMFDGEVKLANSIETVSTDESIDNGLSVIIHINDRDYKFLIDTGASVSVLNSEIFKDLNRPLKRIEIKDVVGNKEERDLFYLDFKIGKSEFSNFAFIKYDLSLFFKNNCLKYDGIIGANILKKLNWKLITTENKLFFSQTPFTYDGFTKPFVIQWAGNIPLTELKVNDHNSLAILDTGHYGSIVMPNDLYIKEFGFGTFYNLVEGKGYPVRTISGEQKVSLKKTQIKNLSIGSSDFSKYEITLADIKVANVGNNIILPNGFIFNFLSSEVAFGISQNDLKYIKLSQIKLCKSETNKVELCFFWKESSNKQLKLGDQLISVDEINTEFADEKKFCALMDVINKKKGPKKLVFKRGSKKFEYTLN